MIRVAAVALPEAMLAGDDVHAWPAPARVDRVDDGVGHLIGHACRTTRR